MKKTLIVVAILAVLAMVVGSSYNAMVKPKNEVENAWAKVQTQYKARVDKLNNLVATVKGAANFEQKTLTDVIEARAKATQVTIDPTKLTPETMAEFEKAQNNLSGALGRLMVVSEQYPQLKANQNFTDLQSQIEGIENRISVARNEYNDAVLKYNNTVSVFPRNIVAGVFGFGKMKGFQSDVQETIQVDFSK